MPADLESLRNKHEAGWSESYAVLPHLLLEQGLHHGVEVGVAFGGHSHALLNQVPGLSLIGVDAYRHRDGYDDPMNLPQVEFDALCAMTLDRLSPFGDRFRLIREDSVDAAKQIDDRSLDFVYLDADHSEAGLLRDLAAWFPKVREGGWITGHDWDHPHFPGVRRAVERFARRFGWTPREAGPWIWSFQKQARPVTFFTPAYNAEATIEQAVTSVFDGNLRKGDQYVVVDDASTDGTAEVLRRLKSRYPLLQLDRHSSNSGGGATRNTAIQLADHALLFCLDADNVLLPGSVDALRNGMERDHAEVVCFEEVRYFRDQIGEAGYTHSDHYPFARYALAEYLQTRKVPGASGNYLFSRASHRAAGGYPTRFGALDTWGFGLRQVATGSTIVTQPGGAYWHRDGHGSYWTRYAKSGRADRHAYELIRPFLHRLHPEDAARLASPRRRTRWMSNLDEQPVRLHPNPEVSPGVWRQRLARLTRTLLKPEAKTAA